MKIGFDAKRLYCNQTGLGNYSRSLVKNLVTYYPEHQYKLYTTKLPSNTRTAFFAQHPKIKTFVSKALIKSLWRSFFISKQVEKDGVDLYHGLSNELPFGLKKRGVKSVVTIHDLIFKTLPDTFPLIDRQIYDWKFRSSCKRANKVIAISESTKQDIIKYYKIDPQKIEVVYQTCNPLFYESIDENLSAEVLKAHNIPNDFLLYVGSVEPRKNLKGIIEAIALLDEKERLPLIVIGGIKDAKYKKACDVVIEKHQLQKSIRFISNLSNNKDLQHVFYQAKALIYPSFYEGFGLPVVEALLSKTPVITSTVSSLPEAAGPHSILVNPNEAQEIAEGIKCILTDEKKAKEMAEKGYLFAIETFAPEVLTKQMQDLYLQMIT